MSSGPFKLAIGDTQEVAGAKIIAPGGNPSSSVAALRYYDAFAQATFDRGFEVITAPTPKVEVRRLDQEILLTWLDGYEALESYSRGGYQFQGYCVYQGASQNGPFEPIAVFDVVDGIQDIIDKQLDVKTGRVLEQLIIGANDAGVQRYISIKTDAVFNPGQPLSNYRDYYFAVTSYYVNLNGLPKVVESPLNALRVAPSAPDYGVSIEAKTGTRFDMTRDKGKGDGEFYYQVVDPMSVPAATYRVTWNNDSTPELGAYTWNLDKNGVWILSRQPLSGIDVEGKPNDDAPIVDGLQIHMFPTTFTPPVRMTSWQQTAGGYDLGFWMMRFIPDHRASAYFGGGSNKVEQLQADLEFRFTGKTADGTNDSEVMFGGQIAIFRLCSVATVRELVRVPFELWDVENNVQINVFLTERNADGQAPWGSNGQPRYYRIRGRPYITPIHTPYDPNKITKDSFDRTDSDATWVLFFDSGEWPEFPASTWRTGDRFLVHFANPVFPGVDEYTFTTTPAVVTGQSELAKRQLQKVNIVPNPYWAHNPMERDSHHRLVRITNLPGQGATIRIFNLAGDLVRKIDDAERRSDGTTGLQHVNWDLRNDMGAPVGSGVYLIHVEVPGVGTVMKKAIVIMAQEQLEVF
ncbi:MAG: hypothetical protein ONB44_11615 [candidate division KSB1 bacterium]|nr:hypothetical protein [candidate division KSB1 bacterium]MDZ7302772.1 hypothetical protein [candidate division KSB1 bacterium]MDZ7310063.1 hypothetical protein [candidate division KSB1 bacterium]